MMFLDSPFFNRINFDKDLLKNNEILTNNIFNSHVLVIGGAGTIGSNYIKELLLFKPKKIVVVDTNENALTELTRDLRSTKLLDYNPFFITYPVNLLSSVFDKIFNQYNFDVIANFSAHKHVRSEKDVISIEALIRNNVFGAIKLLELCSEKKPKFFFSVSTDKAANPVNVMGASKSLMEKLILSKKYDFHVSTARFANVAFSNGSLLQGFINRIEKKQPISCPNDIKRFFVTPKQSGQICLLATFLGKSGDIFFPKLDFHNDQVYFKDIALAFLNYMGLTPVTVESEKEAKTFNFNIDSNLFPIYFFKTDTSGEKTYEEFYSDTENINLNSFESLGYISSKDCLLSFEDVIKDFNNLFDDEKLSKKSVINKIKKYVNDFEHNEKGKNLDSKM